MSRFTTKESSAKRPRGARGPYIRVAVLEVEDDFEGEPTMISERAKGVIRIVEEWGPCYDGKTERSAGPQARREAEELARKLNCPLERMVMETK